VSSAVAAIAVLAGLAVLVAGCRPEVPESAPEVSNDSPYVSEVRSDAPAIKGGRLAFGLPLETNSWNPGLAQWGSYSLTVARTIFDFLTAFDDQGGVHPYLAERFEHDEQYLAWTVTMREGIVFHDGHELTAQDVVDQQRYLAGSQVTGGAFALIDRYEVTGPLTFVVHMNRPFATFPTVMSTQLGAIAAPRWLESGDYAHPIGTGPFELQTWNVGQDLVVSRNDAYWRTDEHGTRLPYLDAIDFRVIADDSARISALRNGDLDVQMQTYATPELKQLVAEARDTGRYQVFSDEKGETPEDVVVFNTRPTKVDGSPNILSDPDARLALVAAIDRQDYVDQVTAGLTQPAAGPFAPGSTWYSSAPYAPYDRDQAVQLVEKVKAAHGGTFAFTLNGGDTPELQRAAQYLQARWQAIGIDVTVKSVETKVKVILLVTANYDASLLQLFDAPNPVADVVFWGDLPGSQEKPWSLNFSGLNDEQAMASILAAEATLDPAEQKTQLDAINQHLAANNPFLWLDHAPRTFVANLDVVNLVNSTLPDGAAGIDFFQGSPMLAQVWRQGASSPADGG
jgi:peptide/nickel transport system substrate-binding protein